MAVRSQLSVPLSQNTAPVFKFDCLYTHDLVRKQKRWQDGLLAFHTFNKRVMVYDLTNNFIGDTHWRETESVQVGDDLRLDRGVLVEVGEAKGRKEQDISEIFARKNAIVREPSSPLVPIRSSGQKPRSISAVLEASKRGVGRKTRAPPPFAIPGGSSSSYEVDSQRSPKRRKLADETPSRRVLAGKAVQSRPSMQPTSNNIQPLAKPAKPAQPMERAPRISPDRVEPQVTLPNIRKNSGPAQTHTMQARKTSDTVLSKTQKSKKNLETVATAGSTKTNRASVANPDERSKGSKDRIKKSKKPAATTAIEPIIINLETSATARSKLLPSKTRRKKLIFQDLLPPEKDPIRSDALHNGKISRMMDQPIDPVDEELWNYRAEKLPSRDVIIISSPVKDWVEFGISEDGEGEFSRSTKKTFTKTKKGIDQQASPCKVKHAKAGIVAQPIAEIDPVQGDQPDNEGGLADDIEDFAELINDENLLASLADGDILPDAEIDHTIDGEKKDPRVPSATIGKIAEDVHPLLEGTRVQSENHSLPVTADIEPANIVPLQSTNHREIEIAREGATIENGNETELKNAIIPIVAAQDPDLTGTDPPAARTTPSIVEETRDTANPPALDPEPQPQLQTPAPPEEKEPEPIEQPPPKADLIPARHPTSKPTASLAPLAPLLRILNPLLADLPPLPPQKPLPQFRPPQQTSHPPTTSRSRRSPLKKSLSTSTDAQAASVGESTIASLARAESDGAVAATYTLADYDDAGPWSREAFDLFGWTSDQNKGRVLGPVAGRACGCRAAAAVAAAVVLEKG